VRARPRKLRNRDAHPYAQQEQKADADGCKKKLMSAVYNFVQWRGPREHGAGLGQELVTARYMRQVQGRQ
jgi:hypothetical protein